MKILYTMLYGMAILLLSSYAPSEACGYAGSNMNYVKARTEEALATQDINKSRFYIYKAIKVIQTSTSRFEDCGCEDAEINIEESLINLKAATRSTSLNGTRILLQEALEQIEDALDALEQHKMHDTSFSSKDFAMNVTEDTRSKSTKPKEKLLKTELYERIDLSLANYQKSVDRVVNSVNCVEARAFVNNIYIHCEQQLLRSDLSEGKKYYNLKTKEITAEALARIGDCKMAK